MIRVAFAHIPHPTVDGSSFCGDATSVQVCRACLAKLIALFLVHVQSARKPDKSFCGVVLLGSEVSPMGTPGAQPSPVYVSIERAREIIAMRPGRDVPDGDSVDDAADDCVPICPGCEANLERFDDANRRRSRSLDGHRGRRALDFGDPVSGTNEGPGDDEE